MRWAPPKPQLFPLSIVHSAALPPAAMAATVTPEVEEAIRRALAEPPAPVDEDPDERGGGGMNEKEFREYLADTGSMNELLRLMVGYCEAIPNAAALESEPWAPPLLPEGPAPNAFHDFAAKALASPPDIALPQIVNGQVAEDVQALLDENVDLKGRSAELEQQLHAARAELASLREGAPSLALRFSGMRASNVPDADPGESLSDPYLAVSVGEATAQTEAVANRTDPEWEAALDLVLPSEQLPRPLFPLTLSVRVMDHDVTNPHDPLAAGEVTLEADEGSLELELPWLSDGANACKVCFSYELLPGPP